MPTAKDIPLGKLQIDYQDMIATAKALQGVGDGLDDLDKRGSKSAGIFDRITASSDKLITRAGKLSSFGRNLRQAGGFLGNDTIIALGDFADGLGDIADSADAVIKKSGGLKNLLSNAAGFGAIGVAANQLFNVVQKAPETFGGILNPTEKTKQAIIKDPEKFMKAAVTGAEYGQNIIEIAKFIFEANKESQYDIDTAQINANNAVFDFKNALQKNPEALNKAVGTIYDALGNLLGPAGGQTKKFGEAASQVSSDQAAKEQGEKMAQSMIQYMQRAGGIASAFGDLQQASKTFETKKTAASNSYQKALSAIAYDVSQKRLEYAKQYNADTLALDKEYYQQRAELAANYGVEVQRAEEDHQKQIGRMTEDHNKKIRKLAESRDALAIEDEMDAYKTERQRADEDYQIAARRRDEDYARQLAQLTQAHQEQEATRREAYAQQLADLQTYAQTRRTQEAAEYSSLLQDIVKAFVDARNAFAAQMQTVNNTNNTANTTINQNFGNGDAQSLRDQVRQETYNAMSDVYTKVLQGGR